MSGQRLEKKNCDLKNKFWERICLFIIYFQNSEIHWSQMFKFNFFTYEKIVLKLIKIEFITLKKSNARLSHMKGKLK